MRRLVEEEKKIGEWRVLGIRRLQGGYAVLFMVREWWERERYMEWERGHKPTYWETPWRMSGIAIRARKSHL